MTELEQYLNEKLEQTRKSCESWLNQQKQGLQTSLNKFMQEQIAYAEQQIEFGRNQHIARFEKEIANLKERRQSDSDEFMKRMHDRMEASAKHTFEVGLRSTENIWRNFIEDCKSQMK